MKIFFSSFALLFLLSLMSCIGPNDGPGVSKNITSDTTIICLQPETAPRYDCDMNRLPDDRITGYTEEEIPVSMTKECGFNDKELNSVGYFYRGDLNIFGWWPGFWDWCSALPWWVFLLLTIPLLLIWWQIRRIANQGEEAQKRKERRSKTPQQFPLSVPTTPANPAPSVVVENQKSATPKANADQGIPHNAVDQSLAKEALKIIAEKGGRLFYKDSLVELDMDTSSSRKPRTKTTTDAVAPVPPVDDRPKDQSVAAHDA